MAMSIDSSASRLIAAILDSFDAAVITIIMNTFRLKNHDVDSVDGKPCGYLHCTNCFN